MGDVPRDFVHDWTVVMYGGAATLVAATILATIQTGYLIPIGISPLHILGAVLLVLGYAMRQRALKSRRDAGEQTPDSPPPPPPPPVE